MRPYHSLESDLSQKRGVELYYEGPGENGGVDMTLITPDWPDSDERPVWAIDVHLRGPLKNLTDNESRVLFIGHGTPGYSGDPLPTQAEAEAQDILYASPARTGYAHSSVQPGRSLFDSSKEIIYLADALGIREINAIFRSGGVSTGLALAHSFPERIRKLLGLVSPAPPSMAEEAIRRNTLRDEHTLGKTNEVEYEEIVKDPDAFLRRIRNLVVALRENKYALLDDLAIDLRPADHEALQQDNLHERVARGQVEALRYEYRGWLDDNLANRIGSQAFQAAYSVVKAVRNGQLSEDDSTYQAALETYKKTEWGFHPTEVSQCMGNRLGMYWGDDDPFSDIYDALVLAEAFDPSQTFIEAGASHFTAQARMKDFTDWFFNNEYRQTSYAEYMGRIALQSELINRT